jgi:hypothetical protein
LLTNGSMNPCVSAVHQVLNSESQCALNCAEKYLKMNQRVSARFQEFQLMANENAMAQVLYS